MFCFKVLISLLLILSFSIAYKLSSYRSQHLCMSATPTRVNNIFTSFLSSSVKKRATISSDEIIKIKKDIKSISTGSQNGIKCNTFQRQQVAEYVDILEKNNNVKDITSSSLLNGKWKLVYTTNEGSSAGKFGPFVGEVYQDIDMSKKFYLNKVLLFNGLFSGVLSATWDRKNNNIWIVKFQDIVLRLFGIVLTEKSLQGTVGTWRNTYLDENFRILYAIGGKNVVKENIYILEKSK